MWCLEASGLRIIAFMNQKGGVGKTTTVTNVGAAMAEAGLKVCLIDMDPQAHLTINYGLEPTTDRVNLYDVLIDDRPLNDAMVRINDRVTLVPSSIDLAAAEVELVSVIGREMQLKRRLDELAEPFDAVLLDCPPSLGLLTLNALAAASEVIIPMQAHFLALQGMARLLETVRLVQQRMNPSLSVAGIVLTLFDSQAKLSSEVIGEIDKFLTASTGKQLPWASARLLKTRIRRNIKLAESPSFGQTILDYEPSSNGAADYRALAREIIGDWQAKPQLPAGSVAVEDSPVTDTATRSKVDPEVSPESRPQQLPEG